MKEHITLKAHSKDVRTEIYIGTDLFRDAHFLSHCKKLANRFALITDDHVGKLYAEPLIDFLESEGLSVTLHPFKSGEKSKSRHTKEQLEDALFAAGHGRDSCILAMGGGVVTDLAGFVAATFCRNVPYLSIPTSLLGMVDASIGGKTGVNVSFGKNLVGATYSPEAIFMDLSVLETLSEAGMREGTAEIIKHGLIAHSSLFEMLADDLRLWCERDMSYLKKLVYESCAVKRKVVESDLKERGMRRMLNFGHTIGHAIETLENYALSHGEAVAMGVIVESLICLKMKQIDEEEFDEIYQLLKNVGYQLSLSEKVTTQSMMEAMCYDKKAKEQTPRFVILDGIGKVETFKGDYCTEVDESLLREALGWMVATFHDREES